MYFRVHCAERVLKVGLVLESAQARKVKRSKQNCLLSFPGRDLSRLTSPSTSCRTLPDHAAVRPPDNACINWVLAIMLLPTVVSSASHSTGRRLCRGLDLRIPAQPCLQFVIIRNEKYFQGTFSEWLHMRSDSFHGLIAATANMRRSFEKCSPRKN